MELIPFLIFAFIAFKIFSGFTKAATKANDVLQSPSAKDLMQRLNQQNLSSKPQRYKNTSPTQRGRQSLERQNMPHKSQNTPWGDNNGAASGARVAANYLKTSPKVGQLMAKKTARKESHKSPVQHGRRGKNMDQNRHRTDSWGQRGDSGLLSGKNLIILLLVGGALLYALSNMPAL